MPTVNLGRAAARPGAPPVAEPRPAGPLLFHRIALLPFAVGAFVSLPQVVRLGPITGLGLLTTAMLGVSGLALLACRVYPKRLLWRALPYVTFLAWACLSSLWDRPDREGLQNLIVYLLFGVCMVLGGTLASRDAPRMSEVIRRGIQLIDWIALALVAIELLLRGLPSGPDYHGWVLQPRPVANVGLVALSWHLSRWYFGDRRARLNILAWLLAIPLTLSRTGTGTALLLVGCVVILQLRFRKKRALFSAPVLAGTLCVLAGLVFFVKPFYDRFFTGDTQLQVGGMNINVSGRARVWNAVIESAWERPYIGHGLGSSQALTEQFFENISHPHNDYLRIWHDLGFFGLVPLLLSFASWLWILVRDSYRAERARAPSAQVEFAGALVLLGLVIIMIPDNALIYTFVMGPAGVMIGVALGRRPVGSSV
jgi:O-antigen ligase